MPQDGPTFWPKICPQPRGNSLWVPAGSWPNSGTDYGTRNRTQETGPPDEHVSRDAKSFCAAHMVGNCTISLKTIVQT